MEKQDSIVVIPTGGGKTVIYTIPTLRMPGITVVLPLLMLMHDQLLQLREKGINTCYVNYVLTKENHKAVIANLSGPDSKYKILLTHPEVLISPSMQKLLEKLKSEGQLNFCAIDEAHCIDIWGVDLLPRISRVGISLQIWVPHCSN